MITIEFNPKKMELTITGHAGYCEERGKDIVCSAVSALFYTLDECLKESKDMLRKGSFKERIVPGSSMVACTPLKMYRGNIQCTYWTVLTGMNLIAENYPENVKFSVVG